jgi:hypothetical protein
MTVQLGSKPLAFNSGTATGPARNWINALAASGALVAPPSRL